MKKIFLIVKLWNEITYIQKNSIFVCHYVPLTISFPHNRHLFQEQDVSEKGNWLLDAADSARVYLCLLETMHRVWLQECTQNMIAGTFIMIALIFFIQIQYVSIITITGSLDIRLCACVVSKIE